MVTLHVPVHLRPRGRNDLLISSADFEKPWSGTLRMSSGMMLLALLASR